MSFVFLYKHLNLSAKSAVAIQKNKFNFKFINNLFGYNSAQSTLQRRRGHNEQVKKISASINISTLKF